jgi:hypothetical protein
MRPTARDEGCARHEMRVGRAVVGDGSSSVRAPVCARHKLTRSRRAPAHLASLVRATYARSYLPDTIDLSEQKDKQPAQNCAAC